MRVFQFSKYLVLSCLLLLATLPAFAQGSINKKPLQDFAVQLNSKLDKGQVDLNKPFSVTLEGYLSENGTFDLKRSKFTKSEGDEQMVKVAKDAIQAIIDTQAFGYLQQFGVEKVKIDFSQNDSEVLLVINSELPTAEKAKTMAGGLSGLLTVAKYTANDEVVKKLLNAASISSNEKNCLINLAMPKAEAHELLKNELQKVKEKSYSS